MIPVTEAMIDSIEKNYKQTYASMVQIVANMYEAAEKFRYEMQQYVANLRKMQK